MFVTTEYSFRKTFGHMKEVVARLPPGGGIVTDPGSWAHIPFAKECKKQGKKAVLGSRVWVRAPGASKKDPGQLLILVPRDAGELKSLYEVVSLAAENGNFLSPEERAGMWRGLAFTPGATLGGERGVFLPGVNRPRDGLGIASSDNLYPTAEDFAVWEVLIGRRGRRRAGPGHIMSPGELRLAGAKGEWITAMERLVAECDTPLPMAENIRFPVDNADEALAGMCREEAHRRALPDPYFERLEYELGLIADKKFADYFLVIADMIRYAKEHMLVGPARGSSAGSVVCWLTRITEIDPLEHGLIFERFVDVNRADLPDIDIDFPDERRHLVIEYLQEKYGAKNVAHIGTVISYAAKSALTDVAKELNIPLWELDSVKDVLIERSSGDARAGSCLLDSLNELDVGRKLIAKYPTLLLAARLEDHAKTAGTHAAGIIVCNAPVSNYCAVGKDASAQIDKGSAETINMLKIDALGLRTLSIIQEACEMAGVEAQSLYSGIELDDQAAFNVLNDYKYSGVFQFEGIALQSVARQIVVDKFDDIAAITALCRPGPLSGGETTRWIERKAGREPVAYPHPLMEPYCAETFGTILYQEQVMKITRELGGFSWADTSAIRKLMSKTEGNEKFAKFAVQFLAGCEARGVEKRTAESIWKAINTFGSWAFNKSHAVAYGLLSYWCAWLKARYPTEFAVANLRRAKDSDSALALLREVIREGQIEFVPFDPLLSEETWTVKDSKLYGGLLQLRGCGPKTARDILIRRKEGIKLTKRQSTLVSKGDSEFADPFPARKLFGDFYDNPQEHFKHIQRVNFISELDVGMGEDFCIIGKLVKKDLRDLNDIKYVTRRNGKRMSEDQHFMLLFYLEDDTARIMCCIGARKFKELGEPIVEKGVMGAWFCVTGRIETDFKMLQVEKVRWLETKTS